jgi:hypothetical protein
VNRTKYGFIEITRIYQQINNLEIITGFEFQGCQANAADNMECSSSASSPTEFLCAETDFPLSSTRQSPTVQICTCKRNPTCQLHEFPLH